MSQDRTLTPQIQKLVSAGIQAKFQQGLALHRQGRFAEAERAYEEVLHQEPTYFDALHLLGMVALQTHRTQRGVELIAKAIELNPNVAAAHSNLGYALSALKRPEEALASYDMAIALKSDYAEAYNNRGNALRSLKRLDEALASYDKAIALKLDYAEAYNNRGAALNDLTRHEEAIASYDKAIALKADYAEAYNNRGAALNDLTRHEEAIASYDKAIALKADYAEAYNNRGAALNDLKRHEEAIASYDKAIALKPDYAEAHNNRGNALSLKRHDEAIASYDKAITLKPDYAEAYNNRGAALNALKRHDEAIASYDKAIALKPGYAEAYNNRGAALNDLKRHEEAIASYDKAIALKPDYAEAYNNRGAALNDLKRHEEAIASYDKAIALKPDYAEAYNNRGAALNDLKRHEEAIASYDKAIALKPNLVEAYFNLGNALNDQDKLDEAIAAYRRVIGLRSDYAEAHSNLGNALKERGNLDQAIAAYQWAIGIKPDLAEAHSNLGNALKDQGKLEEAIATYRRAISIKPDYAEAHSNLGNVLKDQGRLEEAVAAFRRAISIKPDYAEAHSNLGNALHDLRRVDDALASYDKAIALKPDHADSLKNRGLCRLLVGRFVEGWSDYEWRLDATIFPTKNSKFANWQGEDLEGRRLLVFSEQGLGDIIQFARYLPLLARNRCQMTFLARAKLIRLLRPLTSGIEVISTIGTERKFDFQCALMSLPHRLGTDLASIPNSVPYLRAEDDLVARWRERIGEHGFKIGIAWQGNPQGKVDQGRSIPLMEYLALARLPGVRLISLQKQHGLDQLIRLSADTKIETLGEDFDSGPDAFIDTVAVMENLDLIITSDTSIAHLAGALGRSTWVALRHVPDWRWLLDREDSPWYPTMRLFRQSERDNWKPVFSDMERELQSLLSERKVQTVAAYSLGSLPNPTVQVSWGDLIDKMTILEIKEARLTSPQAVANVRRELKALRAAQDFHAKNLHLAHLTKELKTINEALWETENKIRAREAAKDFDQGFVDLARSVYFQNDKRGNVKRQIDILMNSAIVEEKQYTAYDQNDMAALKGRPTL